MNFIFEYKITGRRGMFFMSKVPVPYSDPTFSATAVLRSRAGLIFGQTYYWIQRFVLCQSFKITIRPKKEQICLTTTISTHCIVYITQTKKFKIQRSGNLQPRGPVPGDLTQATVQTCSIQSCYNI